LPGDETEWLWAAQPDVVGGYPVRTVQLIQTTHKQRTSTASQVPKNPRRISDIREHNYL